MQNLLQNDKRFKFMFELSRTRDHPSKGRYLLVHDAYKLLNDYLNSNTAVDKKSGYRVGNDKSRLFSHCNFQCLFVYPVPCVASTAFFFKLSKVIN